MRSEQDVLEVFIFWGRIKAQVYASYSSSSAQAQALRLCPPASHQDSIEKTATRAFYVNTRKLFIPQNASVYCSGWLSTSNQCD